MKKKLTLFLALILVVGCTLLIACGGDDPADTSAPTTTAPSTSAPTVLGGVSLADSTVVYDGTAKSIAVSGAPAGATVTYTVNGIAVNAVSVTDAGTYTVTATVSASGESVTKTATLTIRKADYTLPAGVVYYPASSTVTYDGQYHTPEAIAELPAGVIALLEGAPVRDGGSVGTYVVKFSFSDANLVKNYNAPADITGVTLTIAKADIDMSGVVFDDVTVPFDGEYHTIEIAGVPAQLAAIVRGGAIAQGQHTVTAKFSFKSPADAANYNLPADMTATLTIGAGAVQLPQFADKILPYNGSNRVPVVPTIEGIASTEITIKNADGVVVSEAKLPGVYTIEVAFTVTDPNMYQPVDPVSYTLTVTKAEIAGLEAATWAPEGDWDMSDEYGNDYFVYADGVNHAVKVVLPAAFIGHDVTITYAHTRNGVATTDTSAAGLYVTTATLTLNSDTYILPEDYVVEAFTWVVADKNINLDDITFNLADKSYDEAGLDISCDVTDVAGVTSVIFEIFDAEGNAVAAADAKDMGVYTVVFHFATDVENGYAPVSVVKTVEITAAVIDLSDINIVWDHPVTDGKPFAYYTGELITVELSEATIAALEAKGVTVESYENNSKANVGDYTAVVHLTCNGNFTISQDSFSFAWGIAIADEDAWSSETVK